MASGKKYVCTLSEATIKKAEAELNETPERRERELLKFRELIKRNPSLHCPMDDGYLLMYLRARKFDTERAMKLLVNHFTIRAENDESIGQVLPSCAPIDDGIGIILPKKDKQGRAIMYIRPGQWDTGKSTSWDVMKVDALNMEQVVMDEENQVNGLVVIGNFEGLSMSHVLNMNRQMAKVMTSFMQEGFPLRMKAIHFVNEPMIFDLMFAIIKPFMSSKLLSRVTLHGWNRDTLYEHIDKDALPQELGGTLPPTDQLTKEWAKRLESYQSFYEDNMKYHIELPKDVDSVPKDTGVVGTGFRKLDVD